MRHTRVRDDGDEALARRPEVVVVVVLCLIPDPRTLLVNGRRVGAVVEMVVAVGPLVREETLFRTLELEREFMDESECL